MIRAVGAGWCFLINAASYVAVIASLLLMHIRPVNARGEATGMLDQIREGWECFLRANEPLIAYLDRSRYTNRREVDEDDRDRKQRERIAAGTEAVRVSGGRTVHGR
ncbi:MAG: hypothetical protein ACLQVD_18960 [Capsulimonadaceae bacterium]